MNVTQTQSVYDSIQDLDDDVEMQVDVEPNEAGMQHIIVIDTNILISHLDYVKKILSHGLGAMGFPVLAIPHVVVQELDSLKNQSRTRAVHFINACLKSKSLKSGSFWVQSKQEAEEAHRCHGFTAKNNDDQVLQCCLQYQSLHPERALILCTDDVNLRNKSLPSGVKALSKAELVEEVEGYGCDPPSAQAPHGGWRPDVPVPTAWQWPMERADLPSTTEVKEGQGEETEDRTREISTCVSLMEDCLKDALSAVLEAEMKAVYDDLWHEIVLLKPPWSLQDVLRCMEKHWIAVFGDIFQRRCDVMTGLIDFFTPGNTVSCGTMLEALSKAVTLLEILQGRSGYSDRIFTALSTLNSITLQLQPLPNEENAAKLVAQHDAWNLYEQFDVDSMEVEFTWSDCQATVY